MSADEIVDKLLSAGGVPALVVAGLGAFWAFFRGQNQGHDWASKSDVEALEQKVDDNAKLLHDARESLARIEGLLERKR